MTRDGGLNTLVTRPPTGRRGCHGLSGERVQNKNRTFVIVTDTTADSEGSARNSV